MCSPQVPRLATRKALNHIERRERPGEGNQQRGESPNRGGQRLAPGCRYNRKRVESVVENEKFENIFPGRGTADCLAFGSEDNTVHVVI